MKKSIIAGLLIFSFAVAPVAQADILSDLQAQIASLLAQVRSLQAQVKVAQSQNSSGGGSGGGGGGSSVSSPPVIFCSAFNRYLVAGTALRDQEATSLYNILVKEGLWEADKELTAFDDDVASAVISFQEKYGIRRTGTVGPITRAKLNSLYGCGTIIPRPRNLPPVISGISGPTVLQVNETGTWGVKAYDPEGGSLSYLVNWGDEAGLPQPLPPQSSAASPIQSGTFTHSYAAAGKYTASFIVVDGMGEQARTSLTVEVGNEVNPSDASASINGSPTLELVYDSNNQEASLKATFDITVAAGSRGVNLYQNGGAIVFKNQSGVVNANSQSTRGFLTLLTPNIETATDDYGQTSFVLPPGRIVRFQVSSAANPKQLFAGTYSASLRSLYANTGKRIDTSFILLPAPENSTNSKTIVGEVSPYINSVSSPIVIDANGAISVSIRGVRFSRTNNMITIGQKDFVAFPSTNGGTTLDLKLSAAGLTTGGQPLFVTNTDLGREAGKSNVVWVDITSTTTSQSPEVSLSASLVSADEDHAGIWGEFKPNGRSDWKWSSLLTVGSSKIIKSMELIANNNGEGWSTKSGSNNPLGKGLYPLVAYINGVQIYTAYDQTHEIGNAGDYRFLLYGQPEVATFPGGTLTVEFTDGTSISSKILASSITPNQGDLKSALTFKVSTDKANYSPDETIGITIFAINNSPAEKTLRFNTGCHVSYAVAFHDSADTQVCTQALTSVVIPAYGVKSWTVLHSPAVYRIPPGGYKLVGRVIGYGEATTPITVSGTASNHSASVTSSKLSLGYDSQNKEASLTAVFNVSVTAGSSNFQIYQNGSFRAFFENALSGAGAYANSYRQSSRVLSGNVTSSNDQFNIPIYIIPAGQSVSFEVTITQNPKEMFAGSYYGKLTEINAVNNTTPEGITLQPAGKTSSVTIVGEVSPYLNSAIMSGNLSTDGVITINGTRFSASNNRVNIGGKEFNFPSSFGGKIISFKTSGLGLSAGQQAIFVINNDLGSTAGKSNYVYVNLTDTSIIPALTITSATQPTPGLAVKGAIIPFTNFSLATPFNVVATLESIAVRLEGSAPAQAFKEVVLLARPSSFISDGHVNRVMASGVIDPSTKIAILKPSQYTFAGTGTYEFTLAGVMQDDLSVYAGTTASLTLMSDMRFKTESGTFFNLSGLPTTGATHTLNHSLTIGRLSYDFGSGNTFGFSELKISNGSIEPITLEKIILGDPGSSVKVGDGTYSCKSLFSAFKYVCNIGTTIARGESVKIVPVSGAASLFGPLEIINIGQIYGFRAVPLSQGTTTPIPSITVLSPNGGEVWPIGSTQTIRWSSQNVTRVVLDLVDPTNPSWIRVGNLQNIAGNPGSVYWQIPNYLTPGQFSLRVGTCRTDEPVCSNDLVSIYDISDSPITIAAPVANAPALNLLNRPSGTVGTKVLVTGKNLFTSSSPTTLVFRSKTSSAFYSTSIIGSPQSESLTFIVPARMFDRDGGSVQIETPLGEYELFVKTTGGVSNSLNYTVVSKPIITILSPNGGETFKIGDEMKVRWNSNGLPAGQKVAVNLVKRDGISASTSFKIADVEASAGAVDFPVNLPINMPTGAHFLVEIGAIGLNVSVFDGSDGKFSIVMGDTIPLPTVRFSASPTTIKSGEPTQLTWETFGAVKCSASSSFPLWNGDKPVKAVQVVTLSDTTDFKLTCTNSVGGTTSTNVTVNVSAPLPQQPPSISVLSPNGGETFIQGGTVSGSYTTSNIPYGIFCEVAIVGNKADGSPVDSTFSAGRTIASDRQTFSGNISFNLVPPGNYRVRVDCGTVGNTIPQDQSDSLFTITAPAGQTPLSVSSAEIVGNQLTYSPGQTIKFSVKGIVSNGTVGGPAMGFNVQASLYPTNTNPKETLLQSVNASYNSNTALWDMIMTAPSDTSKTYTVDSAFWCSNPNLCFDKQINKSFTFSLNSAPSAVPSPIVNLSSNFATVSSGSSVLLSWSSSNAVRCTAYSSHSKWGGGRPLGGNQLVENITATTEFRLECANSANQTTSASVTVAVPSSEPIASSTAPAASAVGAVFASGSISDQLASIAAALERIRLQILGLRVR